MTTGEKVEGRKSHAETRPDVVALAKRLARKRPKGGKMSLRAVSAALAEQGYLNERGKPFNPKSVSVLLAKLTEDISNRVAVCSGGEQS